MYAIPVSLLTWGFEAEAERCARKTRAGLKQAKSSMGEGGDGTQIAYVDSLNSDDEYLRIIAKESSPASSIVNESKKTNKLNEISDNRTAEDDFEGQILLELAEFFSQRSIQKRKLSGLASEVDEAMRETFAGEKRIAALEASVHNINAKLDWLCDILQNRPQGKEIL
jgi:hypothetical protein